MPIVFITENGYRLEYRHSADVRINGAEPYWTDGDLVYSADGFYLGSDLKGLPVLSSVDFAGNHLEGTIIG